MEEELFLELWLEIQKLYRLKSESELALNQGRLRFSIQQVLEAAEGKNWTEEKIRQEILDDFQPISQEDLLYVEPQSLGDSEQQASEDRYRGTEEE